MKLAAVIIETRPIPNLPDIIKGHMKHLPQGTDLMVHCSESNSELLHEFNRHICNSWHEMTIEKYNYILANSSFWFNLADYGRVLIFQSDSMLLRPGIEEFMKYDYIGAEWSFFPYRGNGGLSLRNPRLMHNICTQNNYNLDKHGNEDVFFCNVMQQQGIGNLAPVEECRKFSVESQYCLGSLGYHAIDKWLTPDQCKQIREQYL